MSGVGDNELKNATISGLRFAKARLDPQETSGRHRIASIDGQIQDDLLCLRRSYADLAGVTVQIHFDSDLLAEKMSQQLLKIGENVIEADRGRRARILTSDGHELTNKGRTLLGGVANLIGLLDQGAIGPGFRLQQVAIEKNSGKQIIEVVGYACDQTADGGEILQVR